MFVVDLLQSLFCCAVQFKFHDVNKLIGLQNQVDASFTGMIFCLNIETNQFEYNEKYVLVMELQITG